MEDLEEDRLRKVFDACDVEGRGFISVEHLRTLASQYIATTSSTISYDHADAASIQEPIQKIVDVLDRDGSGSISFVEFCNGVRQILDLQQQQSHYVRDNTRYGDDGNALDDKWRSEKLEGCLNEDLKYPELSYNSPKEGGDEVGVKLNSRVHSLNGSLPGDVRREDPHVTNNIPLRDDDVDSGCHCSTMNHTSQNHVPNRWCEREVEGEENRVVSRDVYGNPDRGNEETFECSGFTGSPNVEDDVRDGASPPGSYRSIVSGGGSASYRPSTSTPVSRTSSSRLTTPSAVASHLYRAGLGAGLSMDTASHHSSISDGLYEDIDGNFIEINEKVRMLESKIEELTESQQLSVDRQQRMKDEKSSLIERIHSLEEQLRDIDCRSQQQITEEKQKYQQLLARTDNDKSREIEFLTASLQHVDKEYNELKVLAPQLRNENEKLKKENIRIEREYMKTVERVEEMKEQGEKLQLEIKQQQQRMMQERRIHAQLVDELGKELEELRSSRADMSYRSGSGSSDSSNTTSRSIRKQLEVQIVLLKQENIKLREQCEDIHAQLVSRQLYSVDIHQQQSSTADSTTLAAEAAARAAVAAEQLREELERLNKEELIETVIKEKDANEKLKEYVEAMTLRILERNPSILEVRTRSSF